MTTQTTQLIKALAEGKHRTLTAANDALAEIGKLVAEQPSAPVKASAAANPCPTCKAPRPTPTASCPGCGRDPSAKTPALPLSRAKFDAMSSAARGLYIKSGGQLKD